ncbi:hypothetical protein OG292_32445 [Streptomyces sp. NBC_01511]|uniref:hypothetical protein n=1 Tax=unclassified Streptomyces TaxID=2593676 RepID=UPI003863FE7A
MNLQQNGSATSRVRGRLYALAATFTATAMWAATDSRRLDDAQRHMEKSVTLAALSGDGQAQHQIWRYPSALAGQRGRWADAVGASEAAMANSVHGRDPLYASLSHARLAVSLPGLGERTRTRRALDRADEAFARADPEAFRPMSMDFYTRGELDGLTGIAHLRLGDAERAEFHLHRCLAALRPDQRRDHAYYTLHVAFAQLAQLGQLDIDRACSTAATVVPPPGSTPTGRIPHPLKTFTQQLNRRTPDVRPTLAELYAEVYADRLSDPFFSMERFQERLDGHVSRPGWEAVVGYDNGQAAGYAYGSPLPERSRGGRECSLRFPNRTQTRQAAGVRSHCSNRWSAYRGARPAAPTASTRN